MMKIKNHRIHRFALYTIKPRSNKAILPRAPYERVYPERPRIKLLIFGIHAVIGRKWLIDDSGLFRRYIFLEGQHGKCSEKSSVFMLFHDLRYRRENTWASKFHRGREPAVAGAFDGAGNETAYTWLHINLFRVFPHSINLVEITM